ncbi:unnamed protein product [Brugia timori]|uniref:Ovule protein n=1 Tax=Brugia timori TaxID=42155 RepID=A0A0R3QGA9_9BILA|nr:unnamed protein product [Brugia timori]
MVSQSSPHHRFLHFCSRCFYFPHSKCHLFFQQICHLLSTEIICTQWAPCISHPRVFANSSFDKHQAVV